MGICDIDLRIIYKVRIILYINIYLLYNNYINYKSENSLRGQVEYCGGGAILLYLYTFC